MAKQKKLTSKQKEELLEMIQKRFEKNMDRHKGIKWTDVLAKLKLSQSEEKLWSLREMENSGGEPDVVGFDKKTDEYLFYDCSTESPKGRRSLCYDREGLEARKEHRPKNSAVDLAQEIGIELLTEEEYKELQQLGNFDMKTSSWLKTPAEIRKLGGAIFADFRYGNVFIYHNSAPSYYASRGFRGILKI